MKLSRKQVAEVATIIDYDAIVLRLEAAEAEAGVTVGSWNSVPPPAWRRMIQDGRRRAHQTARLAELAVTMGSPS